MARDTDGLKTMDKWGSGGDVATPESYGITRSEGWDSDYDAGGSKYPERPLFNQILRELYGFAGDVQVHGILEWHAEVDYEEHARVMGSDGEIYRAQLRTGPTQGNATNPVGRADDTIWAPALSANSVGSDELEDDAVGSDQIADDAVGSDQIADDAVGSDQIATEAVGTTELADDSVTGDKVADDAIDSEHLADDLVLPSGVTAPTPADDDDTQKVATTEWVMDRIDDIDTVTEVNTASIANDAVTSDKVADDAINTEHLADDLELPSGVTAPTPAADADDDAVATKEYVDDAIDDLIDGAPGALDTLNELADALGDDDDYAASITTALALKANIASPTLTGTPRAPNPSEGNDSTQIATTAWVLDNAAPTDSPDLTGSPTASTPGDDDDSDRIATTEWVRALPGLTALGVISFFLYANVVNGVIQSDSINASSISAANSTLSFGTRDVEIIIDADSDSPPSPFHGIIPVLIMDDSRVEGINFSRNIYSGQSLRGSPHEAHILFYLTHADRLADNMQSSYDAFLASVSFQLWLFSGYAPVGVAAATVTEGQFRPL